MCYGTYGGPWLDRVGLVQIDYGLDWVIGKNGLGKYLLDIGSVVVSPLLIDWHTIHDSDVWKWHSMLEVEVDVGSL